MGVNPEIFCKLSTGFIILESLSGIFPLPQFYGEIKESTGVELADSRLCNFEDLCNLLHGEMLLIIEEDNLAFFLLQFLYSLGEVFYELCFFDLLVWFLGLDGGEDVTECGAILCAGVH